MGDGGVPEVTQRGDGRTGIRTQVEHMSSEVLSHCDQRQVLITIPGGVQSLLQPSDQALLTGTGGPFL